MRELNKGAKEKNQPRSIRVVIADDHPFVRSGIRQVLKESPEIQIIGEVANGQEALEQAQELQPDVLLLDLEMPVISGIEIAHNLHKNFPAVKILVISSYDDPYLVQEVLGTGAAGYLTKDVVPFFLVDAIHAVAEGTTGLYNDQVKADRNASMRVQVFSADQR